MLNLFDYFFNKAERKRQAVIRILELKHSLVKIEEIADGSYFDYEIRNINKKESEIQKLTRKFKITKPELEEKKMQVLQEIVELEEKIFKLDEKTNELAFSKDRLDWLKSLV